jgi:phosphoglycolate phosphatase-like HAD superfamily hydrolase|tara:strand:+ start:194 stop:946 length:753 start_codon:yes stop_codon:yes gene_type:complete
MKYKGIVFDLDGTLYSHTPFLDRFAERLSEAKYNSPPEPGEFLELYVTAKKTLAVGNIYDPVTYRKGQSGILVRNPSIVPILLTAQFGLTLEPFKEYLKLYHHDILHTLHDEEFHLSTDRRCVERMLMQNIRTAIVSDNNDGKKGLRKLDFPEKWDYIDIPAKKRERFEEIAENLDHDFNLPREKTLWVEDDVEVLRIAKNFGYGTALRTCPLVKYNTRVLDTWVDIYLPDSLRPLHDHMDPERMQPTKH